MRKINRNFPPTTQAKLSIQRGIGDLPNKLKKGILPELGTSFLGTGADSPCLHEQNDKKIKKTEPKRTKDKK